MELKKGFTQGEAKGTGDTLGVTWKEFNVVQFRRGMNVELEHGKRKAATNISDDDALTTGKIALAHLKEYPDYYDRLEKMEKEAKMFWNKHG